MAIPPVTVGGAVTATEQNLLVAGVNNTAYVSLAAASVAGTGVAVSANGKVTFTNASAVSVNGVFSGTYDNYRIMLNVAGRSAVGTLQFRLRQAGTDLSTATYGWVRQEINGTSTNSPTTATAATFAPLDLVAAAGQTTDGWFELYGPALGSYTALNGQMLAWGTSQPYLYLIGAQNSTSSGSDGFTIYPSSGTISGVLRVYGINNLT